MALDIRPNFALMILPNLRWRGPFWVLFCSKQGSLAQVTPLFLGAISVRAAYVVRYEPPERWLATRHEASCSTWVCP